MKALRIVLLTILPLLLLAFLPVACSNPAMNSSRELLSVTIAPSSGTAPAAPNSQVQFVATGTYNTEPYTVTPLQATWGVSSFPQAIASTTQNGLATCASGGSGTTTIEAWVQISPSVCNIIDSAGRPGCGNVGGWAKLICP
ncbi:MAG: hypothetical protein WB341_18520 [Terracidiphilus sp.]